MTAFQDAAGFVAETIADAEIELQPQAMKALLKARDEAPERSSSTSRRAAARKRRGEIMKTA